MTCISSLYAEKLRLFYKKGPYSHLSYKEAIEAVKTLKETAIYLRTRLTYIDTGRCHSFKNSHKNGFGVCKEYAIAPAALLSDNGYAPLTLVLRIVKKKRLFGKKKITYHACFIYQSKKTSSWGVLGNIENSQDILLKDLKALLRFLEKKYQKTVKRFKKITNCIIIDWSGCNFIDGDEKDIAKIWRNAVNKLELCKNKKPTCR